VQAEALPVPPAILILGDSPATHMRANELRLRGYAAWVATSMSELRWLLDQAWIRPAYVVVDLEPRTDDERALATLAPMAAMCRRPVVLIGAQIEDARFFKSVQAIVPAAADVADILDVLARLPT
jgi:hypothetical protein